MKKRNKISLVRKISLSFSFRNHRHHRWIEVTVCLQLGITTFEMKLKSNSLKTQYLCHYYSCSFSILSVEERTIDTIQSQWRAACCWWYQELDPDDDCFCDTFVWLVGLVCLTANIFVNMFRGLWILAILGRSGKYTCIVTWVMLIQYIVYTYNEIESKCLSLRQVILKWWLT